LGVIMSASVMIFYSWVEYVGSDDVSICDDIIYYLWADDQCLYILFMG
jgi:hypothetical protein